MNTTSSSGIIAHVCCPDPTRSTHGAWILPGELEPFVEGLKEHDPSLTQARCFERLGAKWEERYLDRSNQPPLQFYYKDPEKTIRTRVHDGIEFRGGWRMTENQKRAALESKRANPAWEWSRCFEAAGGRWDSSYYACILDEDNVSEEEIWVHLQESGQ